MRRATHPSRVADDAVPGNGKCAYAGKPMLCVFARRATSTTGAASAASSNRSRCLALPGASTAQAPPGGGSQRHHNQQPPPAFLPSESTASVLSLPAARSRVDGMPTTPYCLSLDGPVLLTAPHGKEVWRDGNWAWVSGISGRRLHRRELFTSELVLRLSVSPFLRGQCSFVVWNMRALQDPREGLDPNYLHCGELPLSPWHSALHLFQDKFRGDPSGCVHFDVHGKKDRSGPHIDVGVE
eukprot:gene10601-16311_t